MKIKKILIYFRCMNSKSQEIWLYRFHKQREDIQTVTQVEHKVVCACIQLQICNMSVILVVESFQSLLIFCSVHTGRNVFRKSLDGQATDSHILPTTTRIKQEKILMYPDRRGHRKKIISRH